MRVAMGTVVGVLALLGIAASIGHYFVEPYNTGFLEHPAITNAHVVLGAVYLALAPVQLAAGVRRRAIGYHRWADQKTGADQRSERSSAPRPSSWGSSSPSPATPSGW